MSKRNQLFFPPRWLKCPPVGYLLLDIFIPCKTPLDHKYRDQIQDDDDVFDPESLFDAVKPVRIFCFIFTKNLVSVLTSGLVYISVPTGNGSGLN